MGTFANDLQRRLRAVLEARGRTVPADVVFALSPGNLNTVGVSYRKDGRQWLSDSWDSTSELLAALDAVPPEQAATDDRLDAVARVLRAVTGDLGYFHVGSDGGYIVIDGQGDCDPADVAVVRELIDEGKPE